MMQSLKIIFLLTCVGILSSCRTYPLQKQCNPEWANQQYGETAWTICQKGSLLASISMALAGTGHNSDPGALNKWLKQNDGYYSGVILLKAIDQLGLTFEGRCQNSQIKSFLDQGYVVISAISKEDDHFVLVYGYSGDTVFVNDPKTNIKSYVLSNFVDEENILYRVGKGGLAKLRRDTNEEKKSNEINE